MKKIKITIVALAVCMFALPISQAVATETRAAGMGLNNGTWWAVDGLLPYMYLNPAAINSFKDNAFFETDGTDEKGGIIFNPMGNIILGLFSGLAADPFGQMAAGPMPVVDKNFGFLGGMEMGNMKIGFGLTYTDAEIIDDYVDSGINLKVEQAQSVMEILGGLSMPMGGAIKSIDAGLRLAMYSYSDTFTNGNDATANAEMTSDGSMDINVHGRANMALNEKNLLHILLGINMFSTGIKNTTNAGESTVSNSVNVISLGVSDEIKVGSSSLLFVGLKIDMWSVTNELTAGGATVKTESSYMVIPFFMGVESMISESWQGRFGLTHNIRETSNDPMGDTTAITGGTNQTFGWVNKDGTDAQLNTGLSYAFGNFTFDWQVNVDLFRNGPNFISGKTTAMSTSFAATFNFGEGGKKKAAN